MTDRYLGALRGNAGPSTSTNFYAAYAASALVDKANAGLLTSNAAGSPSLVLEKHERNEQAEHGRMGGTGDLKATQATTSSLAPLDAPLDAALDLDPRPCKTQKTQTPPGLDRAVADPSSGVNGHGHGHGHGRQGRSHASIHANNPIIHANTIMSSNPLKRSLDDSGGAPTGPDAKRRKFRACVTCRRQKARCEFVNAHDRCHRCSVLQIHCVFEGQAHANLLAASSVPSAPIASSQLGLPFPQGPSAPAAAAAAVSAASASAISTISAIPAAYDSSPQQQQQLPRPSAGSEHARSVSDIYLPAVHSSTRHTLTHPISRINPSSDDQIRALQRRLATIESALRACLRANRLADLETFSPQPHVQRNLHPAPLHKPQGEPSPASLHGAASSSVSAHHTTMSHRSDLPLLGSEEATWRHPVKSTYMYFHGMDGPGVDNGRPPNPCGARILSDAQGDQLLRMYAIL